MSLAHHTAVAVRPGRATVLPALRDRACPMCGTERSERSGTARRSKAIVEPCACCGLLFRSEGVCEDEAAYWATYVRSDRERAYDALREPYYDAWWKRVRSLRHSTKERNQRRSVLDVGCVPGNLLVRAAADGWEAHGVETSSDLCELTRRACPEARVWEGFMEAIDFGGVRFDLIVIADCLRHASKPLELLNAAARLLKPRGALVVRELDAGHRKHARRISQPNECDMQFFDAATLCTMLARAGLEKVKAHNAPMSLMTHRRMRAMAVRSKRLHAVSVGAANAALRAGGLVLAPMGRRITPSFMAVGYRAEIHWAGVERGQRT